MASRSAPQPPWKRKGPAKQSRALSRKQKGQARARARAAGRPYPNLVDNMAAARKRKTIKPRRAKKR